MARLLFPDAPSVDRVQATAGTPLLSAAGATARVYLDDDGVTLANILNADLTANDTATLILDNESRLPPFYGPTSGVGTLYVRVDGGSLLEVNAADGQRFSPRTPEWQPSHDYDVPGELVAYDGALFQVETAHTSGGSFDESKFTDLGITATTGLQRMVLGRDPDTGSVYYLDPGQEVEPAHRVTYQVIDGDLVIKQAGDTVNGFQTQANAAENLLRSVPTVNVRRFGAVCDVRVAIDGVITASSTAVTSATLQLTTADVGKIVVLNDPDDATKVHVTTAAAGTGASLTALVLTAAPTFTVAVGNIVIGTDDLDAVTDAVDFAATLGLDVFVPGMCGVTDTVTLPGAVKLRGSGIDYSTTTTPIQRGSVLHALASMPILLQLSPTGSASGSNASLSGYTAASVVDMGVDGNNLATEVVRTEGRRNVIWRSQVWRGVSRAVRIGGQNSHVLWSVIGQQDVGEVIGSTNGSDLKIIGNHIRQGGTGAQIRLSAGSDIMIHGNHMFKGKNGVIDSSLAGNNILVDCGSTTEMRGITITGNIFDGTYGHHVNIAPGAGKIVESVTVTGNEFMWVVGSGNALFSAVHFDVTGAASVIAAVSVVGNSLYSLTSATSQGFKSITQKTGAGGTLSGVAVSGNTAEHCFHIVSGFVPDVPATSNWTRWPNGTTTKMSNARGRNTATGDAATTAFSWAHGVDAATGSPPTSYMVSPSSAAAAEKSYVTADDTNITVTFLAAPAGAAALAWTWHAQV